jgi:hypothetical protein
VRKNGQMMGESHAINCSSEIPITPAPSFCVPS